MSSLICAVRYAADTLYIHNASDTLPKYFFQVTRFGSV